MIINKFVKPWRYNTKEIFWMLMMIPYETANRWCDCWFLSVLWFAVRCFEQQGLFPRQNPVWCHEEEHSDNALVISCCNNGSLCNQNLTLAFDGWLGLMQAHCLDLFQKFKHNWRDNVLINWISFRGFWSLFEYFARAHCKFTTDF